MAKRQIYLPVSEGKRRGLKLVGSSEDVSRILGSAEEETFHVGPQNKPVYIPGASNLTGGQLQELLHKQTEIAEKEAKQQAKNQPKQVSKEKLDDLKGAMKSIAEWRRQRRNTR